MESSGGATTRNWTEAVEDLVHGGEVDQAISFLESTISNLENELKKEELQNKNSGKSSSSTADQLFTALQDLSKLYSTEGFSLRADQTLSRALQIKHRKGGLHMEKEPISDGIAKHGYDENSSNSDNDGFLQESCADDDWEAIADRAPEELLSPQCLPGVSKLSLEDSKAQGTKRRGRGTFSYKKQGLYSDNQSDEPVIDDSENNSVCHAEDLDKRNLIYGTRHVLVLADFPPSTRTTDLEKVLEKFKDHFVIRWVNDTTSLAVFRTPSVALEASNSIQCPFTVRVLDENEELLSSIPPKDLEPPRQRPQTSARTAQRLIAQGMGIRLPSTFGSTELRKQEEARRNRIVSRQNMRDDAWGDDAN
ncbi:hypothetical protein Pfo_017909 [Paulownia fortunei]|nr:hypothetical protein Pfo_017909 [Paulownia fortunei]